MNDTYRVLLLTSIPDSAAEVMAVASRHFRDPQVLFWEMGNLATKPAVLAGIEACDYNLLISWVGGVVLKAPHLRKATKGAVNIHPGPPEHGGCWGVWCQPVVQRSLRSHHGTTVHEIDEIIDHGPIYRAERWPVPEEARIEDVFLRSIDECWQMLEWVCSSIASSDQGTRCFTPTADRWDPDNRHTPIAEIRRWFASLDAAHPAHQERIFMNHPRAIINPPYFDDL